MAGEWGGENRAFHRENLKITLKSLDFVINKS